MFVADMNSARRMELIADALATRGHSSARIEKVIGKNWLRLFTEVWGRPHRPSGARRQWFVRPA